MKGPPLGTASRSHPSSAPELIAYTDGASRGNPGPASYGVVIQDAHGKTLETLSQYVGEATNNVAEYRGLLAALEYAVSRQARRLKIYCDSELIARQMQGRYRVQSPALKPLYERARKLADQIGHFSIENLPRGQNRQADLLANQALDNRGRVATSAAPRIHSFSAIVEAGKLRPLPPLPDLEEGQEYEVRALKR